MTIEVINFNKGINRRKTPLLLGDGELYSCSGLNFDEMGVLKCREPKTLIVTPDHPYTLASISDIHAMHRYGDYITLAAKEYCPGGADPGVYFNYLFHRETANTESGGKGIDTYTKLCCHLDSDFTDSSGSGHAVAAAGSAFITMLDSKFGDGCVELNGTTDYFYAPDHADFAMGSGRFTIDLQTKFDSVAGANKLHLFSQYTDLVNWLSFYFDPVADKIQFVVYEGSETIDLNGSWSPSADTWYYIELIRGWGNDDDEWAICVDGTAVATLTNTSSWPDLTGNFQFGCNPAVSLFLPGKIDEPRVSKGIARRTENGSPPTEAYSGGAYTAADLPMAGHEMPRFADYKNFTFIIDEYQNKQFASGYWYPMGIKNPAHAPSVADSGAGAGPNGSYTCYTTFYYTFPNGESYETGPSPSGTTDSADNTITWSNIPLAVQPEFIGSEMKIQRNLYRNTTAGSTYYLVTTINDNTTTTYADSLADTSLDDNAALSTEDYDVCPEECADIAVHLQRVFLIKERKLYYSEPYIPQAFKADSNITVSKAGEDLECGVDWGNQYFMASKECWYRLQGSDDSTWAIKKTFTDAGIINKHTLARTKYGLLGLWYDGIYLFDGATSRNITERILGTKFFTDLQDTDCCHAEFDGRKYHFYYASSGDTIDSHLILDFGFYPEYILYNDDFVATAHHYYKGSGVHYLAKAGSEYDESGTETIETALKTGAKVFQNVGQRKELKYLHYDINTDGQDVTVTFYVDGSSAGTITLNNSSRTRKRAENLPKAEGYRISIGLSCADSENIEIYEPWLLDAIPVGE